MRVGVKYLKVGLEITRKLNRLFGVSNKQKFQKSFFLFEGSRSSL